jgi:DNA-binding CsgD family transcriptional regulator
LVRPVDGELDIVSRCSFWMAASGTRRRGLTARECQVLTLLARGYSGAEVARELGVSAETVRAHVRNSVTKLRARTRLHAVVLALQRGEITP